MWFLNMESSKNKKKSDYSNLKVSASGEWLEKFEKFRKILGFKTKSEFARQCIDHYIKCETEEEYSGVIGNEIRLSMEKELKDFRQVFTGFLDQYFSQFREHDNRFSVFEKFAVEYVLKNILLKQDQLSNSLMYLFEYMISDDGKDEKIRILTEKLKDLNTRKELSKTKYDNKVNEFYMGDD